jgi:hypothetical protein
VTKDEILQALHILAMGRARHPLHEQLAEKLEAVFAEREPVSAEKLWEAVQGLQSAPAGSINPAETPLTKPRRKKAE